MSELMMLEAVCKEINGRRLLHQINVMVRAGEFLGLVGPNGAGKSTLLRTMAGLLAPSSGTVFFDRVPLADLPRRLVAQQIASVPQATTVGEFRFSSRDVVLMGRYPHRDRFETETDHDRKLADKAMTESATTGFAARPVTELSGGERQRVTLARALAQTTKVLLLDEPTASLDLSHQLSVLQLVRRLVNQQHITAVAALHDLELASRFCDRLLLMHQGSVVADGAPGAVLTAERLAEVYKVKADIEPHPMTNGLRIHVLDIVTNQEQEG
jgi:iron complex transport system ATP-binding protein